MSWSLHRKRLSLWDPCALQHCQNFRAHDDAFTQKKRGKKENGAVSWSAFSENSSVSEWGHRINGSIQANREANKPSTAQYVQNRSKIKKKSINGSMIRKTGGVKLVVGFRVSVWTRSWELGMRNMSTFSLFWMWRDFSWHTIDTE